MTGAPLIQYLGFTVSGYARDYTFRVHVAQQEPRDIKVSIPNQAFNARLVRFQDGPEICSNRLQREIDDGTAPPSQSCYRITDAELEEYRVSHSPKPKHFVSHPKPGKKP